MHKPGTYIINEANGDKTWGDFATYKEAARAVDLYSEANRERFQPAIGKVLADGSITYEI